MPSFKKIFILLYFSSIIIFLAHLLLTKTAVYGDGRFYYSYLPTYLLDQTLNFTKAYKYLDITYFSSIIGPANIYPIGTAIIWTIPFVVANTILIFFDGATGYGQIYEIFIGIWNITLVFIGLIFLRRSLLRFFSEDISNITCIALFTTTNLLFYGAIDVINSHSASFFLASVFLYLFTDKKGVANSVKIGVVIGFLGLVRSQDYLFLLLPALEVLKNRKYILNFFIIVLASAIFSIPQFFLWNVYFGDFLTNPYLKVQTFDFLNPHILGVFFNKDSGVIWTPIIFVSLVGLVNYFRKNSYMASYSLILIFAEIYTIASWYYWWQGASYSARMLVSSLPFLAIGLANFLEFKQITKIKVLLVIFFSIFNAFGIILFLVTH